MVPGNGPMRGRAEPTVIQIRHVRADQLALWATVRDRVDVRVEPVARGRVLLRVSNLNVTRFYTLASLGLHPRLDVETAATAPR